MILEPVLKRIPMVQTASKGPDSGALFENWIPNNRIPWPTDSSLIFSRKTYQICEVNLTFFLGDL